MNLVVSGASILKLVNESSNAARIGSALSKTKPINHGERNRRPVRASCCSRVFFGALFLNNIPCSLTLFIIYSKTLLLLCQPTYLEFARLLYQDVSVDVQNQGRLC